MSEVVSLGQRSPSVTVIVPSYNYGRFLADCVNSVLSQTGVSVSVLIIDDASTDETEEVAQRLAAADSRVEVLRHPKNRGHIATYNEGLSLAAGTLTVLLSADDLLTPGALQRASALFDGYPDVGMVYGRAVPFHDGLAPASPLLGIGSYEIVPGEQWLRDRFEPNARPVNSPTVVVRTSVQRAVGDYRADLPHAGDVEMWMRFALEGAIGVVHADQAWYRLHTSSMSRTSFASPIANLTQQKAAILAVIEGNADRIPDAADLRDRADRALAREGLIGLSDQLDAGFPFNSPQNMELMAFVMAAYPDAAQLKEFGPVRRRIRVGSKLTVGWRRTRNAAHIARHPQALAVRRHLKTSRREVAR